MIVIVNNQIIHIQLLSEDFTMHKCRPSESIPSELLHAENVTVSRTKEELSITCPSHLNIASVECSAGWKCFQVMGILDFELVGIIAKLSKLFAEAEIPVYVVSTYNTDYIFIQNSFVEKAEEVLTLSTLVNYSRIS